MVSLVNKKSIIIASVLVLTIGGGLAYKLSHDSRPKPTGFVNLDPPTKEEKDQAEDHKKQIVQEQKAQAKSTNSAGGLKSVTPVMTTAEVYEGNVEVSGYVPGVFEDGGTCKATLIKGTTTVERQVTGIKNVSDTQCSNLKVPVSELSAGTWQVKLSYVSATAQGSSTVSTVEVR